tara:strand:- start:817 stop:1077 length:261 start_codon:yes stop_codon:yes gene_type:complete
MPSGRNKSVERIDIAFETLKELLITYPIKPGERTNESELAEHTSVRGAALQEFTSIHLETSPNIDRYLGPSRSYGSAMHGQILSVS